MTMANDLTQLSVLLLEDVAGDARNVRELLCGADGYCFAVSVATTLAEAATAVGMTAFDVCLADLNLPDSRGLETYARMQALAPHLPVVVLTGYDDRHFATLAVHRGAQDYLVKGQLTHDLLVRSVLYAIERKRGEEELRRLNSRLNAIVSERTAELEHIVKRLELEIAERAKAESAKDDFLSRVSHELRLPLSIIKEAISLLNDRVPGELTARQEHILVVARRNVNRLGRIINDLLNIAKIESGTLELHLEPFDFGALVADVAEDFAEGARRKGIGLRVCRGPEPLPIQADPQCIEEVMMNLIGNAMKFTAAGHITITVTDCGHEVECVVADTGVGIPAAGLPRVFEKFEQFHTAAATGERGTGLGLAITKNLVEMHGGRIWADSAVGVGSRFGFRIPKNRPNRALESADWSGRPPVRNTMPPGGQDGAATAP